MTKEQIEKYEMCKADLQKLNQWKDKLPFGFQNHGCGSRSPAIEHELEKIHRTMVSAVTSAIDVAIKEIEDKVAKL